MARDEIDGSALREFRLEHALTRQQIAKMTGGRVSTDTIERLEKNEGGSHFSLRVLVAALEDHGHPCEVAQFLRRAPQLPVESPDQLAEVSEAWSYRSTPEIVDDTDIGFRFSPCKPRSAPLLPDTPIVIYTIHDGCRIPRRFEHSHGSATGERETGVDRFIGQRDWGANAIASVVAQSLGLAGHYHVDVARSLIDFGRFPRVTGAETDSLRFGAISNWTAERLPDNDSHADLLTIYDTLSTDWERILHQELGDRGRMDVLNGALLVGVHSYDPEHDSGKKRPAVSLIARPASVQATHVLTHDLFDALFPPALAEFTADRLLLSRIALELECCYIPVASNYPYLLPEGSLELRTSVWLFFHWLEQRAREDESFATLVDTPVWRLLFDVLSNVNSRKVVTHALRAHLTSNASTHGLTRDLRELLDAAKSLHGRLMRFVHDNVTETVTAYQYSAQRTSAFAVEIRKDLLFEPDPRRRDIFQPTARIESEIERIGKLLAHSIHAYVSKDRPRKDRAERAPELPRWRQRELDSL